MRIYNGKNSQVDLPLSGSTRVTIAPHSVSKDVMPSEEFLSLVATSYDEDELALIVSGPYEINMCAHIPAVVPLIVQSLDAAIERFNPAPAAVEVAAPAPVVEEEEEPAEEPAPEIEGEEEGEGDVLDETPTEEAAQEEAAPAKKRGRKKGKK